MSVYEYHATNTKGQEVSLDQYAGKVLVIANTASQCGLTPQYGELQELYDQYSQQGLQVLGFPCNQFGGQEPGTSEEAESFCQLNYGVNFPIFAKIDVNGEDTHPLFQYLKSEQPGPNEGGEIAWNFTKFLVDREGKVVQRFEPRDTPESMKGAMNLCLASGESNDYINRAVFLRGYSSGENSLFILWHIPLDQSSKILQGRTYRIGERA